MKLATALTAFLLHNSHSFTPSIRYTDVALTSNGAPGTTGERNAPLTKLEAFHLPEGESSNMFEGPTPLVKERDACGVGFIANTSEGGTSRMFSVLCVACQFFLCLGATIRWCQHFCLILFASEVDCGVWRGLRNEI